MTPIRRSFLNHVAGPATAPELAADAVALARTAEAQGYDTYWVTQHHFRSENGVIGSPLLLLAHLAAVTSTIRLGTAVVLLGGEHPHRVAEDAIVADVLSGGRLRLGVSAGSHATIAERTGASSAERSAELEARLAELLEQIESDERLGDPADPGHLRHRVLLASGRPERVELAARLGLGLLIGRQPSYEEGVPGNRQDRLLQRYLAAGGAASAVAVSRTIWPAASAEAALAELSEGLDHWSALVPRGEQETHADYARRLGIHLGRLPEIARSIDADSTLALPFGELAVQFQPGFPSRSRQQQALAELAGWLDARQPAHDDPAAVPEPSRQNRSSR